MKYLIILSILILSINILYATDNIDDKVITAIPMPENEYIKIDGRLNDAPWQIAPVDSDFTQFEPTEGAKPGQKTTIAIVYDNEALYIAMCAYEDKIDKIRYQLSRRDVEMLSDWLGFFIDSYNDKRTAFAFGAYVSGVKYDAQSSNDDDMDANWDAVWDVKTHIGENFWTAEFRIPFSQLRFSNEEVQTWGFQAMRYRGPSNEFDQWKFVPKDAAGFVSNFGQLQGIQNIPQPRRLQLLPYVVTKTEYLPKEPGNPFRNGTDYDLRAGGEVKFGLTSNITLDLTFNPDFGQIEADPSEVNLTAYETFFEEKRPFFLEGNNIYDFRIGTGDGPFGSENLFYSRRIGRSPHHEPDIPDDGYSYYPKWTNIIGAAKISGKTANGWSIGVLKALTAEMEADIQYNNKRYAEIIEPRTNYFLIRTQKDFRNGRTTLGAIATNVTRNIPNEDLNDLNKTAYTSGIDLNHRWNKDKYDLQFKLMGSFIQGNKNAIHEAQKSSARYYQRTDITHVDYDSNKTSLSGYGFNLLLSKIGEGHWRYGTGLISRSPGLELNDIGYLRQADINVYYVYVNYVEFKPGKIFRQYRSSALTYGGFNYGREHLFNGFESGYFFQLLNYWAGFGNFTYNFEGLSPDLLRGGPAMTIPPSYSLRLGIISDMRKRIYGEFMSSYNKDKYGVEEFNLNPSITIRPSDQIDLSFILGFNTSKNDRQYVDEDEEKIDDNNYKTHYVVSKIRTKNIFLTTRLNYTFSPDLTVQFYGMPYIFAGQYTNFREVTMPRATNYCDRFQLYNWDENEDFNFKEFRSNLIVRWEYKPGSTIFFVWAHNRSKETEGDGSFKLNRDINRLLNTRSENVFLIKINKWFDI